MVSRRRRQTTSAGNVAPAEIGELLGAGGARAEVGEAV
jgi:hypothetical protein